ncbi:methionyl-tRNA formyltransferase [Acidipila sp. EB88]|nr:methionyl-tRNA formyltransferase [Acidipila sp. EB88]RRA50100.1 methionyl-tRNA formyltransferase [Acidipila sp. EB88]
MRLVLCGTPEFAVPTLEALSTAGHEVQLVLTQPDRPSGRGMQLLASPVKQWALAHGIPVDQPSKIRNNTELRAHLEVLAPDAIVVVAYGRILPLWMLELPRLGCINLHGSLLPKYRGAAPIQWAVARGEPCTGVTTMLLEEGLDTGPMLERAELPIPNNATAAELFPELATLGAPLVLSTLAGLAESTLHPQPQDHTHATHAPILTREDGRVDCSLPAAEVYNRWRGFYPWPGAWAMLDSKKFSITRMLPAEDAYGFALQDAAPGEILAQRDQVLLVCAQGTAVVLAEVQLEGKRSTAAADFFRGHPQLLGMRLA